MGVDLNVALGADAGKQFADQTHHVEYGAYLQSKCIALGIQQAKLPLAKYIVDDFGNFDPKHPEPLPARFDLPPDSGSGRGGRGARGGANDALLMNVLTLSRIQFALTIAFHYIYPPLSIGLGVMLVLMEGLWLGTGKPVYHQMARFWTKVFALTFAIGVATGIVMEFEFGTNWATYSRYVGDVFGSALAAEGIFAFFLESGFLAVLLFGWDRVGREVAFLCHLHGLPGRAFQRHLDRRRQFLDANAGRLSHRGRGDEGPRRDHRFLGDGVQPLVHWTGSFTPCAAPGRRARSSWSASARGIC